MNNPLAQACALISQLTPAECRELRNGVMSNTALRTRILEERTAAIRAARSFYPMRNTPAAVTMARDLERYLATGWKRDQNLNELPANASVSRRVLHRIAVATGGESVRKSTILEAIRA